MKKRIGFIIWLAIAISFVWPVSIVEAAISKSSQELDAWAEVAEDDMRTGTPQSIATAAAATVTVSWSNSHEDAGEGFYIYIQVSASTSGDLDWTTLPGGKVLAGVGDADLETITNNPAAVDTTVFTVASTAGFEGDGIQYIFIEDVADVTKSEIMMLKDHSADTSVTVVDGSTYEHANSAVLSNLAGKQIFSIPVTYRRVRVLYDNTVDADGTAPTIHTHATLDTVDSLG